ncbi:TPA: hypothetical protein ACJ7E6_000462 [Streptococcus pyogenes]|uniref:hypothetical protein n=1 Tax=Streptococcus pyogenes TaxID=1314 RepID=UPI00109D331F|nr:hypothetical protein [Streptococcus pyogenes]VHG50083.1 Uncharacterised protein [Streptococcus pyogenes]
MKTKSKRFLNLATLCLALLGTTLLMGRPVNADTVKQGEGSDKSKVQQQSPYEKGVQDGHNAGYELGKQHRQQNGSSDPTPPSKAPEPKSNPYETESEKQRYKSGWDTMYIPGYYNGWYYDERTDHLESDDYSNGEEGEDISGTSSSTDSTDSTDDGFPDLIDMVVGIATVLWDLVSGWF